MASKAAKRAAGEKFDRVEPPVNITVEHATSGATTVIPITARWGKKIEGKWPNGAGVVAFNVGTGIGYGGAKEWFVTLESLRSFLGKPDYEPSRPKKTPLGKIRQAKPRQPEAGQLGLLDYLPPSPAEIAPVVVELVPVSQVQPKGTAEFRRAAHERLTGQGVES